MISYDIYLFHYYSFSLLMKMCNKYKINVKKYYVYNDDFYLKIARKDRKKVKDNFKDFRIVSKMGIVNFFESLLAKPIVLISLILSICLFLNLQSRIFEIDITGDYPLIESYIESFLKDKGIYKYEYNLGDEKIDVLENELQEKFNDDIESVEVITKGSKIIVNYKKRRKTSEGEKKGNNLYATKDGVIKKFDISNGVKNTKVNDFVRKGDLLVSDSIINNDKESINIGTKGSVYASTYYFIEVTTTLKKDEMEMYLFLIDKARYEVGKNLNSEMEYIEKENILVSDLDHGFMRVYYVLYEDITI